MKALQFFGKRDLRFVDIPIPEIGRNDVLIKVKKMGICGTDLHIYSGGMNVPIPLVMGHEFVGDVVKVGEDVINIKVGDRVVAEHVVGCGKCIYCLKGQKNLCLNPTVIGIHKNGALAEYMNIPSDLVYVLPPELSYDDGVLVEPLSIAVYATRKAQVGENKTVGVVGQGPIGIFVDQVAKSLGAKVYGFDINASRLKSAEEQKYIDRGFNTSDSEYLTKFQAFSGSDGVDVVFEAVGIDATADISIDLVKRGGKVVILGVFEHDVTINMMQIVKKEIELQGSWTCLDSFAETISLIKSRTIDTSKLITNRYKFEDAIKAFEEAADTTTNRIKSVIEFAV